MSLLDDASIVVTPNGYKQGVLFSVIPSSGAADLEVIRATAATRVDENGLVNYAEVVSDTELLTNGDFASDLSGWSSFGTASATGGIATIGASSSSGILQTILTNGFTYNVTINVVSYDGVGTAEVSNNNGLNLYTITTTGEQTFTFKHSITSGKLVFRGTSNALFSLSSVSVKEVLRDNVPRIDYTGGGCPHILAEPQRTNLIPYSEDFTAGSWSSFSVGTTPTLTSGFTAPDGSSNAYKISNPNKDSLWGYDGVADTNYARTIYARTVSGTGTISLLSKNGNADNVFSLTESWQRFEVNTAALVPNIFYAVDFRVSGNLTELLIWGGQSEVGSYATSLIPNFGTAAGVTRNQDIFTRDGIGSLINSTEGVLFLEMATLTSLVTFNNWLTISDGTANNQVAVGFETNGYTTALFRVGGSSTGFITFSGDYSQNKKIAFKWKENDFALWIDGVEVGVDTSGATLSSGTLNSLQFNWGAGGNYTNAKVKQLQVFKTTDIDLAALTS
tara:strand:+ start:29 stop:1543 length:1515 start_codon:yes stop_codon:yes gene_type:complete